ncbi:MAG TPA: peptidoglycan DD-metalloendopeptidase family protein [Candidatus Onthousia faecavium]|nr:peptidoglycan DD-metalloendopeptidase family protein [Candidatus Onthousia faecavium]
MNKHKIIASSLILLIVASYIIWPVSTSAKTIKEFEAEVEKFTQDLENKENQIAKNDAEVAEIEKNIANIESQIMETQNEISSIEQEIEKSNAEIAEKSEESKSLFQYLQISEGENAYLEYVFGATSITDMVYRMAIVEQLTEYNNQIMAELTKLVEENETRKNDLATKNEELEQLTVSLENEQARINADTAAIKEAMPSVEQQLKSAQENLEYLRSLGCGENEDKDACIYRVNQSGSGGGAIVPSVDGFYRPMVSGYVTQNFGNAGHMGIDLGNRNNPTIEIYPIASGVVFAKYYDNAGALVLKIRHNVNGRYIYSTYAHLSAWYVNVGDLVTPNTVIGRMGSTGNSSGPHLHLEVTTCDWNKGGGCTWAQYQNSTINPRQYVGFPSGLYSWWYSR